MVKKSWLETKKEIVITMSLVYNHHDWNDNNNDGKQWSRLIYLFILSLQT